MQTDPAQFPGGVRFKFSGKVLYSNADEGNVMKGAYGVRVALLFHDPTVTGSPSPQWPPLGPVNLNFSHPVPGCIGGFGLTTHGTHWCTADVDGNFSFDFYTNNIGMLWSHYTDFVLLVTTWNDACSLGNDSYNPFSWWPCVATSHCNLLSSYTINGLCSAISPAKTFQEGSSFAQACPAANLIDSHGKITLNPVFGGTLRYMQLNWEFDHARLGLYPAQAPTVICPRGGSCNGGGKCDGPKINFTDNSITTHVVSHEYGHHLNYTIAPQTWLGRDYVEDFGELHQFAARNWMSKVYDEAINWNDDNREECTYSDVANTYYPIYGYASFLWNVYDKYDDAPFRADRYAGRDNDDVGEPLKIFSTVATTLSSTQREFTNDLEQAVSPGWPTLSDEATSIEAIYQFNMNSSHPPMRPAQVKNLSGGYTTNIEWEVSEWVEHFIASLSWDFQNYSSSASYENPPTEIHVYQKDWSGVYQLVQTLAGTATSTGAGYPGGDLVSMSPDFKVTAYNASGESYGAQLITLPAYKIALGGSDNTRREPLSLSVFPNPSAGLSTVNVTALSGGLPAWVRVYDQLDNVVATLYEGTPEADMGLRLTFDGSRYPAGTYYVKAQNAIMGWMVKLQVVK